MLRPRSGVPTPVPRSPLSKPPAPARQQRGDAAAPGAAAAAEDVGALKASLHEVLEENALLGALVKHLKARRAPAGVGCRRLLIFVGCLRPHREVCMSQAAVP